VRRRTDELAALFTLALAGAFASSGCVSGTDPVDGTIPPVGSSASVDDPPVTTATVIGSASATVPPRTPPPPHDDSTAEGYAAGFQSIGPYTAALSGLELLGFADVVDGKMVWEGKDCPPEWSALSDGTFTRAAIVRKSRTLAVITAATFERWVGPVDTPEKAALRAQLEDGRTLATCARVKTEGFECARGSAEDAVAVREAEGGFEVATYDVRPVCGNGRWGTGIVLGASRVTLDGVTTESRNVLTQTTYAAATLKTQCHYPTRGRAYEGFVDAPPEETVREYHARAAHHEAAAAIAFDRLASELARHGAPAQLVADARGAADDERRHARLFLDVLGERAAPVVDPPRFEERSLVDLLLENAAEGCANETYAAVIATHQADAADDARVRAIFRSIAPDEQRHAELAHRVHAWGLSRLDPEDAARVAESFSRAVERLSETGDATAPARALGEPAPELARAAFRSVVAALHTSPAPLARA